MIGALFLSHGITSGTSAAVIVRAHARAAFSVRNVRTIVAVDGQQTSKTGLMLPPV